MDALYILGTGSLWDNWELRFSLRSLHRFATGVDRVFVVGEDPGFLSKAVKYFAFPDPSVNREYNIASKIFWACQNTDISDRFFFINDDHILVDYVKASEYPYYHKGDLVKAGAKAKGKRYSQSLSNTAKFLQLLGKSTRHYDIHTPIIYDRALFTSMTTAWDRSKRQPGDNGFVVKSTYCNLAGVEPGPKIRDCKITSPKGIEDVERRAEGRNVISFGDTAIPMGVCAYLQKHFPEFSPYEMRDRPKPGSQRGFKLPRRA